MLKFFNPIKKIIGLFALTNEKILTFSKASKTIANASYEGAYLNLGSSFGQHQVKIVATHNKQKFEMLLPVVLQHGVPTATLVQKSIKILKPN